MVTWSNETSIFTKWCNPPPPLLFYMRMLFYSIEFGTLFWGLLHMHSIQIYTQVISIHIHRQACEYVHRTIHAHIHTLSVSLSHPFYAYIHVNHLCTIHVANIPASSAMSASSSIANMSSNSGSIAVDTGTTGAFYNTYIMMIQSFSAEISMHNNNNFLILTTNIMLIKT